MPEVLRLGLWLTSLALLGCGDNPSDDDPTGTGAGGSVDTFTPPDAGMPEAVCPPGELIVEGGCLPAGIPIDGCSEGFAQVGDGCEPMMPASCPPGEMAVPGDAACHVVASCPSGTWGTIPTDADTEYVDQAFQGVSDGSAIAPWITVQQAIDAAVPGAVVAIAAGDYGEQLLIAGKAVALYGVCPGLTQLRGVTLNEGAIRLHEGSDNSELHTLSITGVSVGLQINGASGVVVDRVWVRDQAHLGIDIERTAVETGADIYDSLIESALGDGIFIYGADVVLDGVVVRDTRTGSTQMSGRGVSVGYSPNQDTPSAVTMRRSVVEGNKWIGVFSSSSSLVVESSVIRDTVPRMADGEYGYGLLAQSLDAPGSLVVDGALVENNYSCGICTSDTDADIRAAVVRGVETNAATGRDGYGIASLRVENSVAARPVMQLEGVVVEQVHSVGVIVGSGELHADAIIVRNVSPAMDGTLGSGIDAELTAAIGVPSTLALRGSIIDQVQRVGIAVSGSEAALETVAIRNVAPELGVFGRGISIEQGPMTTQGSIATIAGCEVDGASEVGIAVLGSEATISATAVRNVLPRPADGLGGFGIDVQVFLGTGRRSTASIEQSLIERAAVAGVIVISSDATIDRTAVFDIAPASDGTFGDGVVALTGLVAEPTNVAITKSHIAHNPRAGSAAFYAFISLADSFLECNDIALNGENDATYGAFQLEDRGGNGCGCGDDLVTCKVLSSSLTPPSPLATE